MRDLNSLAKMIAKRDNISYNEARSAVADVAAEMQEAFFSGDLNMAEDILRMDLGLEPDYLDYFIF